MRTSSGKFMRSKVMSACAETGKFILKGHDIFYSFSERKAYSSVSSRYRAEQEAANTSAYIQAQEETYFDSFCQRNGI